MPARQPTPQQDEEFAANAVKKEALLVEAEALVPVGDLDEAKRKFRDIAERWDAAGKVPRDRMKDLEARIRKVEQEIRGVEDAQWKRTDPEKSARADDMVSKLESAIADIEADLEKARAAGNEKKVKELEDNLVLAPVVPGDGEEGCRGLRLRPSRRLGPKPKESSCVRRTEERQRRMRVARLDDHPTHGRSQAQAEPNGVALKRNHHRAPWQPPACRAARAGPIVERVAGAPLVAGAPRASPHSTPIG